MMKGTVFGNSYMRLELSNDDMHTFSRTFDICDYENVCVSCDLPMTSLPPSLHVIMDQLKQNVSASSDKENETGNTERRRRPRAPSLRIGFRVGNEYRYKKLDYLHDLMHFQYDDEDDAHCSVVNETRRTPRDGYPVFEGTIDGIPFRFMRTHNWYASYYTVDDQQDSDSFFTDPVWDIDSDDDWEEVAS